MCNTIFFKTTNSKMTKNILEIDDFPILMGAPNGGKCPNCPTGRLSFDRYGPRGEEYYSCVKCGHVVKN